MTFPRANLEPKNIKLDEQTFQALVARHEAFAAGQRNGVRARGRFVVAQAMRCDRRVLADADFTGANLSRTTFIGTDLTRASLFCVKALGCDFRGARLFRADLRGATFSGSKFAGATLDEADLRAAVLMAADPVTGIRQVENRGQFTGASLDRANLSDAMAHGVDLTHCTLRGAHLRRTNLKNADLSYANLDQADLAGARLSGARLHGAILTGVDVEALGLSEAALAGCLRDPDAVALSRLDEILRRLEDGDAWVTSDGARGAPTVLDGFDLRPAKGQFAGRVLPGFTARSIIGVGVDFNGAQLQGAVFDGADLRGAVFRDADLRGASFRDAQLAHADFTDANLDRLPLARGHSQPTRFDGATLHGTGLIPREAVETAA